MIVAIQILLLVAALVFFARAINITILARWYSRPQPPGLTAVVLGKRCYYTVKGEGTPTIVIEAGLGASSAEWWGVQDTLAEKTRVFTYDRAGYGWSEFDPGPRTSQRIASELKQLLDELGIAGSLVLVGQGLGSLYVNHFCRMYPDSVAGIVLMEPTTPEHLLFKRLLDPNLVRRAGLNKTRALKFQIYTTGFGLLRLLKRPLFQSGSLRSFRVLAPQALDAFWHNRLMLHAAQTALNEYVQAGLASNNAVLKASGPFPGVPLRIISHSSEKMQQILSAKGKLTLEEARLVEGALQNQILAQTDLSPRSKVVFSHQSAYNIHLEQPELVTQSILEVLAEARR